MSELAVMSGTGDRIANLRKQKGFTRAELASKARLSASAVYLLETGRRGGHVASMQRIADALLVPTSYLLGGESSPSAFYGVADLARAHGLTAQDLAMCVRWLLEARKEIGGDPVER